MHKSDLFFNVIRLPVDFTMLIGAGLATYFLRTEILSSFRPVLFQFNLPFLKFFYLEVFVSFIFLGAYAIAGLYLMRVKIRMLEEFSRILLASSAGILVVIIYIFLRQELFDSRFLVLGGWFFAILFVCLGRLAVRYLQALTAARYDLGIHRVLVVGDNETATNLISYMGRDLSLGYRIAGQLTSIDIKRLHNFAASINIDEIVLARHDDSPEAIQDLISFCQEQHIIFKFVPTGPQLLTGNFEMNIFGGLPMIEIKRTNLDGWGKVIKRILDIIGSLIGLIIFSPLFLVITFSIKWETQGPLFARLKRISGKKEFILLKFRSMIENAEELKPLLASLNERSGSPLFKIRNDPRITKVGRFMRKMRIDELPQLWNIFRGDMSLVGPRPHQPDEITNYQRHHKKVLSIKAGATGLAQVSGSSDIPFEEEVALDSFYIDHWSLLSDFKIIIRTILKMLSDKSAV